MDYQETINFMFNALPMYQREGKAAYKNNLNNSIFFDNYLKQPHLSFKSIHIAGTNGKGSCSHMLASVLQQAGYKVGLYTSPHLKNFRERIKINGCMITQKDVVNFIDAHKSFIEKIRPSFFEMTVFMAFDYFKNQKIDIAIIETGMGGRLDSTNLINPLLSIITNIGLDHTQFLGDTLEKIAHEKAGIIKKRTPVIIGAREPKYTKVFEVKAQEKNAPLFFANEQYQIPYSLKNTSQKQVFQVMKQKEKAYHQLELDLLGHYQTTNLITVLSALNILKETLIISEKHIREGLSSVIKNTGLLGRWQIIGHNPMTICDTGHNEDGVTEVVKQIASTPHKKLWVVWGMVNDKKIDNILKLLPKNGYYIFTKASVIRSLDSNILLKEAQKHKLQGICLPTVPEALEYAKQKAHENDLIFIGGSTFIVADIL